ncbi:MAG: hypothetical protein FJ117_00875 [Deltaproteobacteria bacterium]|nr:hypothetical protein [Deltaproteobacteria bacterium]
MEEKICFFIAPIGDPGTEIRKRSDQILKYLIEPVAMTCGYKAIRADKISEPGIITSQVIQHVIDDPMVVADLTGWNPNVFYELAIRHTFRKPYVQIIQKGERIPFDVSGIRTVEVDHHDLDSVEEAKGEITRQMKSMERPEKVIESPISATIDLDTLRKSERPEQRQMADILTALAELRTGQSAIEKRITDQERYFFKDREFASVLSQIVGPSMSAQGHGSSGPSGLGAHSTGPFVKPTDFLYTGRLSQGTTFPLTDEIKKDDK